ncbi:TRAP transporter small permease subunit [Aidingimonas halophila]|uniref:TRAP transporter small permease protein n=1 Tax=Aidingimonas halophila TaxID=574349 RepID=A0A1H2SSL4_9GAMM|nr:TRAP transporter small permease subunit [Aidingimonas halophila]GHC17222.1 C4-dicarboxylate ABC transporter [Aidingimonas halophila]SDW34507.1 TRAP-type mannitol/chloroaromatic compound transport system, small permease component [Aidingimonas halophila]
MPKPIRYYVRYVDAFNRRVGRLITYLIFVMIGVLLISSIARTAFNSPMNWVVELSQFMMVAYFLVGGAYSMQMGAHVRMDLLYGRMSLRRRAALDVVTILFLIVFLVTLLLGGISSTQYALQYGERSYSSWAPPLAPIKIIMTFGIVLMLLQSFSTLFKDLATARGEEWS